MRISFQPNPPVPQQGIKWMADRSLPYGPFQPTIVDDACSFECDSTLWELWVEFHQTIRFNLQVESTPPRIFLQQLYDKIDASRRLLQYEQRLADHLARSDTVSFPPETSYSERWEILFNTVSVAFPTPSMDGEMHQSKLWICIVHELTQYHSSLFLHCPNLCSLLPAILLERIEFALDSLKLTDVLWIGGQRVGKRAKLLVASLPSTVASYLALPSSSSSSDTNDLFDGETNLEGVLLISPRGASGSSACKGAHETRHVSPTVRRTPWQQRQRQPFDSENM
ncbi:hypothetical protein B0H16DRAFT_145888 [Mycena metata]|uniref:Uncharacterized protein n=1 Tax=Mycena metata TaxID=1033252 RepID=A0AAD7JZ07_9AGAR|nr:hypothetical protein B0H16DRAFT_145888 [Mycena metata]